MTQGSVDLRRVDVYLRAIETSLGQMRNLPASTLEEFKADRRNPAAAESMLRRTIQALFDLLRYLVAKVHGRGLLEYKELARVAKEKGLVQDPRLASILEKLAGYRNRLIHFYDEVTDEELHEIIQNELQDLEDIAEELRQAAVRATQFNQA